MDGWKMSFLLGFPIFRGCVKLRGGNLVVSGTLGWQHDLARCTMQPGCLCRSGSWYSSLVANMLQTRRWKYGATWQKYSKVLGIKDILQKGGVSEAIFWNSLPFFSAFCRLEKTFLFDQASRHHPMDAFFAGGSEGCSEMKMSSMIQRQRFFC